MTRTTQGRKHQRDSDEQEKQVRHARATERLARTIVVQAGRTEARHARKANERHDRKHACKSHLNSERCRNAQPRPEHRLKEKSRRHNVDGDGKASHLRKLAIGKKRRCIIARPAAEQTGNGHNVRRQKRLGMRSGIKKRSCHRRRQHETRRKPLHPFGIRSQKNRNQSRNSKAGKKKETRVSQFLNRRGGRFEPEPVPENVCPKDDGDKRQHGKQGKNAVSSLHTLAPKPAKTILHAISPLYVSLRRIINHRTNASRPTLP